MKEDVKADLNGLIFLTPLVDVSIVATHVLIDVAPVVIYMLIRKHYVAPIRPLDRFVPLHPPVLPIQR